MALLCAFWGHAKLPTMSVSAQSSPNASENSLLIALLFWNLLSGLVALPLELCLWKWFSMATSANPAHRQHDVRDESLVPQGTQGYAEL